MIARIKFLDAGGDPVKIDMLKVRPGAGIALVIPPGPPESAAATLLTVELFGELEIPRGYLSAILPALHETGGRVPFSEMLHRENADQCVALGHAPDSCRPDRCRFCDETKTEEHEC